jgi:flagellar biosynthesis regulator FlbT
LQRGTFCRSPDLTRLSSSMMDRDFLTEELVASPNQALVRIRQGLILSQRMLRDSMHEAWCELFRESLNTSGQPGVCSDFRVMDVLISAGFFHLTRTKIDSRPVAEPGI